MSTINMKLLPLKLIFFFLYGALGCLIAFITNHMYHIGLTHEEVTWINTILPLTALAGPPAVGYLADRFGHYKFITIFTMALVAIFNTSLLFVPEREVATMTPLHVVCNNEGSSLVLQSCRGQCPEVQHIQEATFRISECRQECGLKSRSCSNLSRARPRTNDTPSVEEEMSTDALTPPLICQHKGDNATCNVFSHQTFMDITRELNSSSLEDSFFSQYEECCEYPFSNFYTSTDNYTKFTCQPPENCFVVCTASEISDDETLLQKPECLKGPHGPRLTFWLYFCLRAISEMLIAVLVSLLDAVILTMVAQHGGDYGRQKMFGLFAVGITAPVVGYLMDKKILIIGNLLYAPVFYTFDLLMIFTAFITLFLPFKVDVQRTSLLKNLSQLIRTVELNVLFFIVIVLGTLWGFLETFLFIHMLTTLQASQLIIGLTVSAGVFPSLPFLYKSDAIVRICGHHYLLILAFVGYCIRFASLSYVTNPHWVILIEVLKLITLNLMQVASATLAYKLAPKTLVATAQGIVWMSHFNIGRSIGTIVGGYLVEVYSMYVVFSGASVLSAIFATTYLSMHQYVKYIKERESLRPKPSEAKGNGNIPNGTYLPLPSADRRC